MARLIVLACMLLAVACSNSISDRDSSPTTLPVAPTLTPTPRPCGDEAAIEAVRPSVVRVSTDGSVGTGIIVAENRVLTNAHVVEGTTVVRVESQAGAVEGTVIRSDAVIDVALIQAPTRDLPIVEWADPTELRAGQRLLAVGYALDLPGEPSSTGGIFSALRTLDGIDYVQTDAPINPGNSGGPLFTQCGEIVGLNTFTLSDVDLDLQGLGFAIRSTVLRTAVQDLGSDGYVQRAPPTSTSSAAQIPADPEEPTDPIPVPTEGIPAQQPSVATCGAGSSAQLVGLSPIGRTFQDGETISIPLQYSAPGCAIVVVYFWGYHVAGSPWYQYWCVERQTANCEPARLASRIAETVPVGTEAGSITLTATGGAFPPPSLAAAPSLEGFVLCHVRVTFTDDGRFGGPEYSYELGAPCASEL